MKFVTYEDDSLGTMFVEDRIPNDLEERAYEGREQLLEAVSDFDDTLMKNFSTARYQRRRDQSGIAPGRDQQCCRARALWIRIQK